MERADSSHQLIEAETDPVPPATSPTTSAGPARRPPDSAPFYNINRTVNGVMVAIAAICHPSAGNTWLDPQVAAAGDPAAGALAAAGGTVSSSILYLGISPLSTKTEPLSARTKAPSGYQDPPNRALRSEIAE